MRTLLCLLKQPSETYKAFNDRLAEACAVVRPSGARCTVVGAQPKVDLIAVDDDETPVRVAVCPLEAGTDQEASRTQERLARVLAAAEGRPVFTADTEPPLVTVCMWPLAVADEDGTETDREPEASDDDAAPGAHRQGVADDIVAPAAASTTPVTATAPAPAPALRGDDAQTSPGRPPFGFRRRAGRLEEDPDEADLVRTVLDAYDSGLTDDRIISEMMDAHGEWVREHWQPKEIARHVRRILDKAAFYRRKLIQEAQ
jgi:hypothetical protein